MAVISFTGPSQYFAVRSQCFLEIISDQTAEPNLEIQIEFKENTALGIANLFPGQSFSYRPNADGVLKIDVKDLLLSLMESNGSFSQPFKIAYRDISDNHTGIFTLSSSFYAQYVKTNFGVTNDLTDLLADTSTPGEFLNNYPVVHRDFKKQISFIPSSSLNALQPHVIVTQLDINRSAIGSLTPTNTIQPACATGVMQSFVLDTVNIDNACHYLQVELKNTTGTVNYIDPMVFRVDNVCSPVLSFEYLSNTGAFETVVFQVEQTVQDVATVGTSATLPITSPMVQATRTKTRFNVDQYQFVRVNKEGVNFTEFLALLEIKESEDVTLMVNTSGSGSLGVRLSNQFNTEYSTAELLYDMVCEFELPNNFKIGEGVDYTPTAGGAFLRTAFSIGFN